MVEFVEQLAVLAYLHTHNIHTVSADITQSIKNEIVQSELKRAFRKPPHHPPLLPEATRLLHYVRCLLVNMLNKMSIATNYRELYLTQPSNLLPIAEQANIERAITQAVTAILGKHVSVENFITQFRQILQTADSEPGVDLAALNQLLLYAKQAEKNFKNWPIANAEFTKMEKLLDQALAQVPNFVSYFPELGITLQALQASQLFASSLSLDETLLSETSFGDQPFRYSGTSLGSGDSVHPRSPESDGYSLYSSPDETRSLLGHNSSSAWLDKWAKRLAKIKLSYFFPAIVLIWTVVAFGVFALLGYRDIKYYQQHEGSISNKPDSFLNVLLGTHGKLLTHRFNKTTGASELDPAYLSFYIMIVVLLVLVPSLCLWAKRRLKNSSAPVLPPLYGGLNTSRR